MRRRDFVTAMGSMAAPLRAAERPPDIIFLMTDQQRWDALGVLNPRIHTPSLDRIARGGIVYNQATCQAPMCVPSRNAMMFGLYPSQTGIRSNGSHSMGDPHMPFDPLPAQLRRAGYQTAGFGKTHWGITDQPISTRGFEVRAVPASKVELELGARYPEGDDLQGLADYRREVANYGPGEEGVPGYIGCTSQVPERNHPDGWIAGQCMKFLDGGVDPNRPLFLYLSFYKPHAGFNVPKRFEDLYRIEDIPDTPQPPWAAEPATHLAYCDRTNKFLGPRYRQWHAAWSAMSPLERRRTTLRYYANCSWLESYFGQALDRLENLGRLRNALIVYTADHGEMLGERQFRFSKYCLYESSARVPIILSGTAVPRRGVVDDRPAELVDLFPTIARVAGFPLPPGLPGMDLLGEARRPASFCEFHDSGAPAYMWRSKDWKLIFFMEGSEPRGELYDLKADPHEWNNLYDSPAHAAIREQLKTELLAHLATRLAKYPTARG